jgi:hypothetical protein
MFLQKFFKETTMKDVISGLQELSSISFSVEILPSMEQMIMKFTGKLVQGNSISLAQVLYYN